MKPDEFHDRMEEARRRFEEESAALRERIAKAEETIRRSTLKLTAIQGVFKRTVDGILGEYAGLQSSGPPVHEGSTSPAGSRRTRRGSLDRLLLEVAREVGVPDTTVPDLADAFNERHQDQTVPRSTVRGVIERLIDAGELEVTRQGSRGNANPTRFKVVAKPEDSGTERPNEVEDDPFELTS
jgi:hypothetical protein